MYEFRNGLSYSTSQKSKETRRNPLPNQELKELTFSLAQAHMSQNFKLDLQQIGCIAFHRYTKNFLLISLILKNIRYFIDHVLVNVVERLFSRTEQTETKLSGSESVNGT